MPPLCDTMPIQPGASVSASNAALTESGTPPVTLNSPRQFGPRMRRPVAAGDVDDALLERLPGGAGLGKARGEDRGNLDPCVATARHRIRHGGGRDHDEGMIDRPRRVPHGRKRRHAHDLPTARIDRHDAAAIARLQQQTLRAGIVLRRISRRADQGHGTGAEKCLRQTRTDGIRRHGHPRLGRQDGRHPHDDRVQRHRAHPLNRPETSCRSRPYPQRLPHKAASRPPAKRATDQTRSVHRQTAADNRRCRKTRRSSARPSATSARA